MAKVAEAYLDYPFRAGGTTPDGFGTPGFVRLCHSEAGCGWAASIPAKFNALRRHSVRLSRGQLRRGDLVFFRGDGGRGVVGVYLGDDDLAYASSEQGHVVYDLVPWDHVTMLARLKRPEIGAPHPAVVAIAQRYLGVPYVYGGASPSGFDASGLTMYCYAQIGIGLSHGATMQQRASTPVPISALQPGDLVFFGNASYSHHVGIYVGGGSMIHAPHTGAVVSYGSIGGAWIGGRL